MSETTEPSYYEIALTNRQVVIAFVILLTLVLAIFLCGVWVGKNGQERLALSGGGPTEPAPAAATADEPDQLANMEEFKFFKEEGARDAGADQESLDRPDLTVLDKPTRETTLAQDIGSAPQGSGNSAEKAPAASQTPPPQTTAPPKTQTPKQQAPPPEQAPKPRAPTQPAAETPTPPAAQSRAAQSRATPTTGDGFVVQVFSTRDEPQARKVLGQLKSAGHKAFLSAVEVTGQTMYRVRVGPFAQRNAADQIALQVRRQMKLDPWVTAAGN